MYHILNRNTPKSQTPRPSDIDHVLIWDDVSENVRAVEKAALEDNLKHMDADCFLEELTGRGGITNWAEACLAVEKPWEEGIEIVQGMIETLERSELVPPHSIRRTPTWNDQDGDFDLDRFTGGDPYFRGVAKRDVTGQQFVTILVQVGANANASPHRMLWRGATAIALTHLLEAEGYSCEILIYDYSWRIFNSGRNLMTACWVKKAHHHLDISALTVAVSGWYQRVITWATYGMIQGQTPSRGFGKERKVPEHLIRHLTTDENYMKIEDVWSLADAKFACGKFLDTLKHEVVWQDR